MEVELTNIKLKTYKKSLYSVAILLIIAVYWWTISLFFQVSWMLFAENCSEWDLWLIFFETPTSPIPLSQTYQIKTITLWLQGFEL